MSATELGTLIWIGSTSKGEFSDAFEYCYTHAPQMAVRSDCRQALQRPSCSVRGIVITHATRSPIDSRSVEQLEQAYPNASLVHLLGSHCEGMQPIEWKSASKRLYWHRWEQVLPNWLSQWGFAPEDAPENCRSVAIVSSSMSAAGALMDLAESVGVVAVWVRTADPMVVRNVDAVWWDDSVAGPVSAQRWRNRIAKYATPHKQPRHAWIATAPRYDQQQDATAGGVERILSKPYRIDGLLEMLEPMQRPALNVRAA